MGTNQNEIQIRVLPRSNEKGKPKTTPSRGTWPRWAFFAFAALLLLTAYIVLESSAPEPERHSASTNVTTPQDRVNKHLQDTWIRRELMRRERALQVAQRALTPEGGSTWVQDDGRTYGLLFDQEDTAQRLYKELNQEDQDTFTQLLPEERINSRLANRKWLNEVDRAENLNFIRTFIRNAYERGYEVQINEDLVVVGVRKIPQGQKVNIDQVLDRLAQHR